MKIFNCLFSIENSVRAAALVLCLAAPVRADTLWVSSGGNARALEIPNVKVTNVLDGKLLFTSSAGRESEFPAS